MKKKILAGLAAAAAAIVFSACTSVVPVQGNNQLPANGYKILGRVTTKTSSTQSGYTKLLAEAQKQYPGADDVVNILVDKKTTIFLIFVFQTYEMSALAVDYD